MDKRLRKNEICIIGLPRCDFVFSSTRTCFMEYGLMLGFNKYIIPFQRESQKLPFNVAGLDTIKYTSMNVERLARDAIDQAIEVTQQDTSQPINPDQVISVFL